MPPASSRLLLLLSSLWRACVRDVVAQADKEIELEKEIARGNTQDRKMLIEESFLHANNNKPVRPLEHVFGC